MNDAHDNAATDLEMLRRHGTPEVYPETLHKLPAEINGHAVLAWAGQTRLSGNYPGGIALCFLSSGHDHYVVWLVYSKDGGDTWFASGGQYSDDHETAWREFFERADEHPATSA